MSIGRILPDLFVAPRCPSPSILVLGSRGNELSLAHQARMVRVLGKRVEPECQTEGSHRDFADGVEIDLGVTNLSEPLEVLGFEPVLDTKRKLDEDLRLRDQF